MRKEAEELKKKLYLKRNKNKARILQKFFKTGKGEYGEGDIFLGITVPEQRKTVKEFYSMDLKEIKKLLESDIHEERFSALIILREKYCKNDNKKEIFNFYLKNLKRINNWDLVDVSASYIMGNYLLNRDKDILFRLARSKNLWMRRAAIVATFWFIRNNRLEETLAITEILLKDKEDLIHKATGWMLRETGKKSPRKLKIFLKKHKDKMPRTMIRYAIEKFPEKERKKYLNKSRNLIPCKDF